MLLLIPGPVTTDARVKAAGAQDYAPWDNDFRQLYRQVCEGVLAIAQAEPEEHVALALPGCGHFAVEAAIRTFVPPGGRLLAPSTGAYAARLQKLAGDAGRVAVPLHVGATERVDPQAVAAALRADVVVLALGEPQRYSGEAQSRVEITLPPAQQALAEAVAMTGKPLVVLLRNGRALALQGAVRNAAAVAVTWYLGTQTGPAVADVLFGDYNPSGRLPVSFPQVSGQQPFFYNHPRTGRPELPTMSEFKARWREIPNEPLYPFGHGMGYTTYGYGVPQLSQAKLGWDDALTITTTVTNTGDVAGEEVVQLYIHDRVASRVRPVRELKGFRKIALQPGESAEVVFTLDRHALGFTGRDGVYRAEPGLFDVWVCASSISGEPVQFELLAS